MATWGAPTSTDSSRILGRSDFQLKLRGIRIEPGEIESTLRAQPGVKEAVVSAKDLGGGEPSLLAYVVLDERSQSTAARVRQLRDVCRTKLPDYMVPVVFATLPKLPVNLNQKVDRRALPMPTAEDFEALRDFVPPHTPEQVRLAKIWEHVIGAGRPIGIRDNFFEVGGNSLLSVDLMVEIERVFGRALPLSTLLTDPTVEKLAQALERPAHELREELVLLRDGGDEPPLFLVHDGEGETLPYLNLSRRLTSERKVYGIQPRSTIDHPMLHSRLSEVVQHYVTVVRKAQPTGPYYLGGLCIGGFIALEMARQLQQLGETVALVVLLDAAHVHAALKSKSVQRLQRFTAALEQEAAQPAMGLFERSRELARTAYRKGGNVLSYELSARTLRARNNARMRMYRWHLDRGLTMPEYLRGIPVQVVLRFAEREFVTPEPYRGEVVLLRATHKNPSFDGTAIDDTPYVDIFASPLLGWEGKVETLKVFDAGGGHSSMLQEPDVEELARLVQARIDAKTKDLGAAPTQAADARDSAHL
ncbi:MAG: thioesterase domain-containing protein [Myxococcales bacterium]